MSGDVVEKYVKMLAVHRVALCFGSERKLMVWEALNEVLNAKMKP